MTENKQRFSFFENTTDSIAPHREYREDAFLLPSCAFVLAKQSRLKRLDVFVFVCVSSREKRKQGDERERRKIGGAMCEGSENERGASRRVYTSAFVRRVGT